MEKLVYLSISGRLPLPESELAVNFLDSNGGTKMSRKGSNIYKRKDGRWEGRYILGRKDDNQLVYGYVYAANYHEAKLKLQDAIRISCPPIDLMRRVKKNDANSLKHVASEWLKSNEPFLKESSYVKYKNLLDSYLLPSLGAYSVYNLTNLIVEQFRNQMLQIGGKEGNGLSAKTVADLLSLLRSIQRYASARTPDLPCPVHSVSVRQNVSNLQVMSLQEQRTFCNYLIAHLTLPNLGILMCISTGIRIGELCALRWGDISLREKTVYVHQTLQRLQQKNEENIGQSRTKIMITEPKSSCSMRIIPLPDWLVELLHLPEFPPEAFFLTGEKNHFMEPRTMNNHFKRVLEASHTNPINFHSLRHTFATRCIEAGFDIKSLSEILGHANVNITLNRYVHPSMNLKRENMGKLDGLLEIT